MRGGNVSRYTISDTSALGKYLAYAFCNQQTRGHHILDLPSGEFLRLAGKSKSVDAKEATSVDHVSQIDDLEGRACQGVLREVVALTHRDRLPVAVLASCAVIVSEADCSFDSCLLISEEVHLFRPEEAGVDSSRAETNTETYVSRTGVVPPVVVGSGDNPLQNHRPIALSMPVK